MLRSYVFDITRSYDILDQIDSLKDLKNEDWWTATEMSTIGVEGNFVADIYASAQSPAYWMERLGTNWIIYNPNVFGEFAASGEITLQLVLLELIFKVKLVGFKFTPLDYTLAVDLEPKRRVKAD